jgi:zinc transport system permease protein
MLEALAFGFIQRALAAGLATAFAASYYGSFVVQRGMSFLGDGLAHAAFGGVALALLLGGEPLVIAVPFTVLTAVLITFVRERTDLQSDTVIGVFFALTMALGIVFLSLTPTYSTDAFTYLFGSILAVNDGDVVASIAVAALAIVSFPLWGKWAYATFDRETALADRIPVRLHDYILSVLIAVTIVVSAKVVGIVLASAFLIIPAASSRLVTRRFFAMTVSAILIGCTSVVVGLSVSYTFDLPSGATIVLAQTAAFFACLAFSSVARGRRNGTAG